MLLGVGIGLDPLETLFLHVAHAIGDPLHVLLDGLHHIGEHRGAAGAGDDEEVGKAPGGQAEIGARALGPFFIQGKPAPAANVHTEECARHGIEARGEHQVVAFVLLPTHLHTARRDLFDGRAADVHQVDMGLVVGLIIMGVDAEALAPHRRVGREQFGDFGVVDDVADLLAHEPGGEFVEFGQDHQPRGAVEEGEPTIFPVALEHGLEFLGAGHVFGVLIRRQREGVHDAETLGPGLGAKLGVARLEGADFIGIQRAVARRDRVIGRALKDMKLRSLLGDNRNALHRRRAGTDHADPAPSEIDFMVGPAARVIGVAREIIQPLEVGGVGRREAARGHDEIFGRKGMAPAFAFAFALGLDLPTRGCLVVDGGLHPGVELDIPAQVEAVGDVLEVAQDLGLARVALGPFPLLLELLGKLVGVLHALDIAARARVAVPIPGAPHPARCFVGPGREPHPS